VVHGLPGLGGMVEPLHRPTHLIGKPAFAGLIDPAKGFDGHVFSMVASAAFNGRGCWGRTGMVRMMLSGSYILLLLELVDFAQVCPVTWLLADIHHRQQSSHRYVTASLCCDWGSAMAVDQCLLAWRGRAEYSIPWQRSGSMDYAGEFQIGLGGREKLVGGIGGLSVGLEVRGR
jgi:hypothetical protein